MSMDAGLDRLRSGFQDPPAGSRPMMRWWWFGPAVERPEIERELRAMADAGIGGVEVAYVYPLGGDSPEFLSPEFLGHLRYAADTAAALGLRFDLTLGSGWSYGGPHVTPELAARGLHFERRDIPPGPAAVPVAAGWPGDELVAAYLAPGSARETPAAVTPLPVTDGALRIPADRGPRHVVLAYARLTGQVVKRAAAGADGPVLDHYSAAATRAHLAAVGEPLLRAVPGHLLGSVFCDSLEVYGANWTPGLPAEFERRRGYPLLPRLYQLVVDTAGADQLRADFHRTLTELYEENFVAVVRDWAAGHGVRFRIQSYGVPPARVASYRYADLYEGEGFGWREITQTRWASSAAHRYGLPVVSSETWTWVHSPSFRATPLDLKGEAHEHLLAGVNQFVGHGWPYSPRPADGLGWYFYAAGALDDRNPWWPAMPELMRYLRRLCWLLRQGEPVADVLLYVPCEDIRSRLGPDGLDLWRATRAYVDPAIPATIREAGWDFDLADDETLRDADPARAPVVVLPRTARVPDGTRAFLDRVAAQGGTILAVDGEPVGAARPVAVAELDRALRQAIPPDLGMDGAAGEVAAVHRGTGDADVYLVVNTGPGYRAVTARPRVRRRSYEVWDASTGSATTAGTLDGAVDLALHPYQAAVLVLHDGECAAVDAAGAAGEWRALDGTWVVGFEDGSAAVERRLPHRWEDDPGRAGFSGAASYRIEVQLDRDWAESGVSLDFGPVEPDPEPVRGHAYRARARTPVGEIVEVTVNDRPCGVLWAPPYAVDVSGPLRPGANTITLRVSNTAANALSADRAIHDLVEASRARYGHRFAMQDLDRATDDVNSGLLRVPVLRRTAARATRSTGSAGAGPALA
jgi:glycosyl hydrolase family 106( putative alpha-L-rhamnosidase)